MGGQWQRKPQISISEGEIAGATVSGIGVVGIGGKTHASALGKSRNGMNRKRTLPDP